MRKTIRLYTCMIVLLAFFSAIATASYPAFNPSSWAANSLQWVPCPSVSKEPTAKCGQITVLIDKTHPHVGYTGIGFVKIPASNPALKKGTIFINPGGPGIPAVSSVLFGQLETYPQWIEMRKYFDFIAFDPRGVGVSNPVDCAPNNYQDNHLGYTFPTNSTTYQKIANSNKTIATTCLKKFPLIKYMDTKHVADDMDLLRAALGLKTINFYGISYGTLLGQMYATKYPQRINKMVLDGVVDHSINLTNSALMEGAALETILRRMDDWCNARAECEIRETGVKKATEIIVNNLRKKPIVLDDTLYPAVFPRRETIDSSVFMHYFRGKLYSDTQWYEVTHVMNQVLKFQKKRIPKMSKYTAVTLFENTRTYFSPGFSIVNCQDYNSDLTNLNKIAAGMNQLKTVSPIFWEANQNWDINLSCLGWPIKPNNPVADYRIHTAQPILYSNPIFDAITPVSQAVTASLKADKAIINFSDAEGHSNANNSSCGRQTQLDYFLDKPLPPSGSICQSF